jgi:hypothetical protein
LRRRWASFVGASRALWLVLVALFVPLPLTSPVSPSATRVFAGADFTAVMGRGHDIDGRLAIEGFDPAQGALQVRAVDAVDAAAFPVLRYRFDDFPRTLELVLVFRERGARDVHALTLPVSRSGRGAFDLSLVPEWRGRIVELGFAQYPVAQSVSPAAAFEPFALVEARLESRSWSGALAIRAADWFGARHWQLLSLSALGPDGATPAGRSLVLMIALGVAGMIALAAWLFRWPLQRLAQLAAVLVLLGWLALDLRWLVELRARIAGTSEVYAGMEPEQRQRIVPDQALFDAAQELRQRLAEEAPGARVLVDAGSDYERARLIYHLLPLDAAPLFLPDGVDAAGAIVVLHAAPHYRFDAAASALHIGDRQVAAVELAGGGALRVYRLVEPTP